MCWLAELVARALRLCQIVFIKRCCVPLTCGCLPLLVLVLQISNLAHTAAGSLRSDVATLQARMLEMQVGSPHALVPFGKMPNIEKCWTRCKVPCASIPHPLASFQFRVGWFLLAEASRVPPFKLVPAR